jgi:hypothetical protein
MHKKAAERAAILLLWERDEMGIIILVWIRVRVRVIGLGTQWCAMCEDQVNKNRLGLSIY